MDQTMFVKAPEDRAALEMHDLRDPALIHSNLEARQCSCRTGQPMNGAEWSEGNHAVSVWPDGSVHDPVSDQPRKFDTSTGDACVSCGSVNMRRTGSCMTCSDCGTSGGCA